MKALIQIISDSDNTNNRGELKLQSNTAGDLIVLELLNPYRRIAVKKEALISALGGLDLASETPLFTISRKD